MNENDVVMFHSNNPETKAQMVERLIRTVRGRLAKLFESRGKVQKYWDALPGIMRVYNKTQHSSHGLAPDEVNETNSLEVFNALYSKLLKPNKVKKPLFKCGDRVRIYVKKALFVKGDQPNFKDEICTIFRVLNHRPEPVYVVKSSKGAVFIKRFYEQEL